MKLGNLAPFTLESELRHVAFITHSVPAERVRRHVPKMFQLETFLNERNEEMALVSVGCFRHHGFHWTALPFPKLNFEQVTYRTYVRYKERVGVFFFATILNSLPVFTLQRLTSSPVYLGKISTHRKANDTGYHLYQCQSESTLGQTKFQLEATDDESGLEALKPKEPFINGIELAQRLTYRLHGFIRMPGNIYGDQIVVHSHFKPWYGHLQSARFDLWQRLGIMNNKEAQHPFSVVVQPSVVFRFLPPFPISLLSIQKLSHDDLSDLRAPSEKRSA